MIRDGDRGTEADGSISGIYCTHCYQMGQFTQPNASIEEMTDVCAGIMSEMFSIPKENARSFVGQHLRVLKRWSGRMIPSCKSCGMPLVSEQDAGTESDGSVSREYCTHCYQNGAYTEPDLTRETMIEKYAPVLAQSLGMPLDKARKMVTAFTSALPRWN